MGSKLEHSEWLAAGVSVEMQSALGRVVVNGAHMENLLGRLCEAIYSNDDSLEQEKIWNGTAAARRQLAQKLVRGSGTFREDAEDEVRGLLDQSKVLAESRNSLFHGAMVVKSDGSYWLADSRADEALPISVAEVDKLGRDLHAAWDHLDQWVSELNLRIWYFNATGLEL